MILFTGFEPFDGAGENPSWLSASAAAQLCGERGLEAVAVELPCAFGGAGPALLEAVERYRPSAVVCTGLASGRDTISLERVALNLIDARIPDNAGEQPVDVPVNEGGPLALMTRLPVKRAMQRLVAEGIPASLSFSAGSYVCNSTFYVALHQIETGIPAGFVHVPERSVVPIAQQAQALALIAEVTLEGGPDASQPGGSEY